MFRVRADHPHDAFAANNLAILTNPLHAGSDFHGFLESKTPHKSLAAMN
jgi:hypothetical protein